MIFLSKLFKPTLSLSANLTYKIKIFNDFLFFINIIKNYLQFIDIQDINSFKISINILNLIAVKYILYSKYYKFISTRDYSFYKIYDLELFYLNYKKINKSIFKSKNISQRILFINKISRTRAKGRVKRYKVILLIGNKSGWFGLGKGKDYYLQDAISKARINAFKNIYQVPLLYSNLLNNDVILGKSSKKIYLFSSKYKTKIPSMYSLRVLFDFIGFTNINSKVVGIKNIHNILSLIMKL